MFHTLLTDFRLHCTWSCRRRWVDESRMTNSPFMNITLFVHFRELVSFFFFSFTLNLLLFFYLPVLVGGRLIMYPDHRTIPCQSTMCTAGPYPIYAITAWGCTQDIVRSDRQKALSSYRAHLQLCYNHFIQRLGAISIQKIDCRVPGVFFEF